ncbi:MAG: Holliday junction resolvase RuvX [Saprospirales bacterium]|nr:MAG: Holliday junction resolvase RuvX [Saprospirales bacterium]
MGILHNSSTKVLSLNSKSFLSFSHLCKNFQVGRILAIDYGSKKSGLASTDSLKIAAHGLKTIATVELIDFLISYTSVEDVEEIVIGLPRHADGNLSGNANEILKFGDQLKKLFPKLKISFFDESYSSVEARKRILESGAKKKKRRDKSLVDKIAAVIILQSYLGHI